MTSFIDNLIIQADKALRVVAAKPAPPSKNSPAEDVSEQPMSHKEQKLSAGLMRINHTGEVCAQALYQGQSISAKLPNVRSEMEQAAAEEADHLAWCEQRLQQLNSQPSILNPIFYGLSFSIGYGTGLISDRISLGFIGATEDQVCKHLYNHSQRLPSKDQKSQAIIQQMINDEERHGSNAYAAGGVQFPAPVKGLMSLLSKVMTESTFRL